MPIGTHTTDYPRGIVHCTTFDTGEKYYAEVDPEGAVAHDFCVGGELSEFDQVRDVNFRREMALHGIIYRAVKQGVDFADCLFT